MNKRLYGIGVESMRKQVHRKIYTYNLHLAAASYYLDAERDGNQSEHYNSIGTIVFLAFALDGLPRVR